MWYVLINFEKSFVRTTREAAYYSIALNVDHYINSFQKKRFYFNKEAFFLVNFT